MKVTFLGTGTSSGVPYIGCNCPVCCSADKKDNRLRTSIWIQSDNTSVIIDSGPDFRYQMLRAKVPRIDAIVFTHGHKDHVAGLDDIRAYNLWQQEPIDLYVNDNAEEVLRREFQYVFNGVQYPGIPQLHLKSVQNSEGFQIKDLNFQPIRVLHYKLEVFGYRVGDFCYITDVNYISEEEKKKIKGCHTLVLSALRKEKHISHYSLSEAIEVAQELEIPNVYFTHISHQMGLAAEVEKELPEGFHLAYDGLVLDV